MKIFRRLTLVMLLVVSSAWTATPPALINYQGVLRDAAGAPLNGNYDMVFRFYSASSGGTLLLTDTHNAAAPSGQVSVANGLFTAQLGAGTVAAGSEPNLAEMFRDNVSVWLDIQVGTETLIPRVRVAAAAYAQNAKSLDGNDVSAFAAAVHNQDASTITTGTLAAGRGGTGLSAPGSSGNVLTSNGTTWSSAALPAFTEVDGVIGNEVTNATNATLARSGSGTGGSPYTLALNLGNANTWTAQQTFSSAQVTGALKDTSGDAGTNGQILLSTGTGTNWGNPSSVNDGDWTISGSDMYSAVPGNVGIGTAAPTARLDVDGSFNVGTYSGEALDQTQTSGSNIWNGTSQWQSFTAGATGALTEVDIYLQSPYASSDTTGTLSIYSGTGTGGSLLATQSVVLKVTFGWQCFPIAIPPQVISGQVYTFLVMVSGYDRTWWETQSGNPYAGGRWWYDSTYDTMFKTWVSTGTDGGFTVTSGGNVGIQQSNPGFPLTFASTTGDKIALWGNSGSHYGLGVQDNLLQIHGSGSSDSIAFGYGSSASFTELMRIKGNGEVGIGTNAPAAGLHVLGSGWFGTDSGSLGSAAGKGVRIFMDSATTPNTGRIFAYDYTSGVSLNMTLQNNGGNVGIGNIVPAYKLQLNQDSAAKPNGGSWTNPSDRRLKKNIIPFADGLEVIGRIRPVRYQYNGLAGMPPDMNAIGVVAQDMLPVAPYTVGSFKAKLNASDETETELLDFNGSALTFVMINAIKELDARTKGLSKKDGKASLARELTSETASVNGRDRPGFRKEDLDEPAPSIGRAEILEVAMDVQAGEVVVMVPNGGTALHPCYFPADPMVVGIALADAHDGFAPIAAAGFALIKADATQAPIAPGDLLTTSANPGHAMKAVEPRMGTVVAKALEPLEAGTGVIQVLVMLR